MEYTLRPHQEEALSKLRKSYISGKRTPLLMAPTGSGKTLISVEIIKRALAKGKRVLFVCDRVQLIDQTSAVFDKYGLDHNVIQADHWRYRPSLPLHLASIQTLAKRKVPDVDLIIQDECHAVYESFTELMKKWTGIKFLGLSATPFTKKLGLLFDDLIQVENTKSLIEKGYLCEYVVYGNDEIDLDGLKTVAGDYEKKELTKRVTKVIGSVVDTWLMRGENRQTLCFAVNVAHSKSIVDEFLANGVQAAHFDAYTKPEERQQILNDFESGKIKILCNVGITTKGFDSPNTDCLILARPTKSLSLFIQMCGRVLRVSETGSKAIILDHGNNVQRLGFPCDELPDTLCNGEKKTRNDIKKEELEKELKAPKPCPDCNFMHDQFKCPQCGSEPKLSPRVEMVKAELKKLVKMALTPSEDRNKRHSKERKQEFYSGLLEYANSKHWKEGWAAMKYKARYSVWPNAMDKKRGVVNGETLDFITSGNISYSKSKKHKNITDTPHDKPVEGYIYTKQTASNGMLQVKATLNGKYKFFAEQTPEIMAIAI